MNAGAHKFDASDEGTDGCLFTTPRVVEIGEQAYEKLFKERTLRNLQRKARQLGFDIIPMASTTVVSQKLQVDRPLELGKPQAIMNRRGFAHHFHDSINGKGQAPATRQTKLDRFKERLIQHADTIRSA